MFKAVVKTVIIIFMKKLAIIPFLLLFISAANAQYKTVTFRAGAGYLSDTHAAEVLANSAGAILVSFFVNHDFRIKTSGVYSMDALVSLKDKHHQVGLSIASEKLNITEYNNDKSTNFNHDVFSVMPEYHYNYLLKPKSNFYSGAAMGVKFARYSGETDNINKTVFAYHFTLLGFTYGNTVACFGELGFGSKGLLRAGVAVSF